MMKFASFETIVEMMYQRLPGQKSDYSTAAQTGVAFSAGYLAGILCAIVSHPADVMVSKLNSVRKPGEGSGAALAWPLLESACRILRDMASFEAAGVSKAEGTAQ